MYSAQLIKHLNQPRRKGDLPEPDTQGEARYPPCGDWLRLTMCIQDGRLTDTGFTAGGCGAAKAAGSAMAEHLLQKTVEEARNITAFEIDTILGGLPPSKRHAIWMVLECLHHALGPRTTTATVIESNPTTEMEQKRMSEQDTQTNAEPSKEHARFAGLEEAEQEDSPPPLPFQRNTPASLSQPMTGHPRGVPVSMKFQTPSTRQSIDHRSHNKEER